MKKEKDIYIYTYIYIYIDRYRYIYIVSRINTTAMNLLHKVSRFFYDLEVNVLLTKIFLVLERYVNCKRMGIGEFFSILTIKVV